MPVLSYSTPGCDDALVLQEETVMIVVPWTARQQSMSSRRIRTNSLYEVSYINH